MTMDARDQILDALRTQVSDLIRRVEALEKRLAAPPTKSKTSK